MKIAIVHDWLNTLGGAENVLAQMVACYPQADVFTLMDFLDDKARARLGVGRTTVSFLQRLPFARTRYRSFLPLMPAAIESFDLREYDLVLSSSHAVAKGVIIAPRAVHLSYIHSPPRYLWDLRGQYFHESGFGGLKAIAAGVLLSWLRSWDVATSVGIHALIANSSYVAARIRRCYGREAAVLHPPVDTEYFVPAETRGGEFFLTGGRFVAYKKFDLIIDAFRARPDRQLVIFGDGPDADKLKRRAPANVNFVGRVARDEIRRLMQQCAAFVYAAEEDFGIVMPEALATGAPLIAFGRGGSVDILPGAQSPAGLLFERQDAASAGEAVDRFLASRATFSPTASRDAALRFASERFRAGLRQAVDEMLAREQVALDRR